MDAVLLVEYKTDIWNWNEVFLREKTRKYSAGFASKQETHVQSGFKLLSLL
jgi:hypothetical protein